MKRSSLKRIREGVFQSEISEIECEKRKLSVYLAKRLVKVF